MRIWAEIYNGAQTRLLGVVTLAGASIVQALDKAGSMTLDVPATDPQAVALMQWGRWVYVYTDTPRTRRVGRGILMRHNVSITGGQKTVSWRCIDSLVALQRANTLTARVYDDVPIARVIRDLMRLVSGWSVRIDGVSAGATTSQRFDGVSVLEAITTIADLHGYHFRPGVNNQLVFGELGEDSGLRLVDPGHAGREMRANSRVALVEALTVLEDGAEVINWLMPFSGPVDGALTLKRSTRKAPYPIKTAEGANGETIYFIRDDASIEEHGEIRAVEGPKQLVFPVSVSDLGFINAANVLYDWAATQLQRRSRPQLNYGATVAKLDRESLVGQQVRLTYQGEAHGPNRTTRLVDVDTDFWVTQQTARYSLSGVSIDLELSSNSEPPRKPEQMVAQILKRQNRLAAQMSVAQRVFKDTLTFNGYGDSQSITFEVSERSVDLASCRVTIRRDDPVSGPDRLRLVVDDEAEVPGGPFLEGANAGLSVSVDIADVVLGLSEVRGEHTLTITALYGAGNLVVSVSVYEAVVGLN